MVCMDCVANLIEEGPEVWIDAVAAETDWKETMVQTVEENYG